MNPQTNENESYILKRFLKKNKNNIEFRKRSWMHGNVRGNQKRISANIELKKGLREWNPDGKLKD